MNIFEALNFDPVALGGLGTKHEIRIPKWKKGI